MPFRQAQGAGLAFFALESGKGRASNPAGFK
jgi:hypothetical protein